jgi:hypothetical protein
LPNDYEAKAGDRVIGYAERPQCARLNPFAPRRNKEPPMKFALLGYHLEQNWDAKSKSEQDAMVEECFTYDKSLLKDGHMLNDGAALQPSSNAKTLRWQNGAAVVCDGPFAETKEQLGGVGLLEARDMAHALEFMSKHPGLRYGSTFEIRPIDEESLERRGKSVEAWRSAAPPVDPQAQKFASLGYINEGGWGSFSKNELDAMMEQCIAFDEARVKSGQWLSGIALQGARTAKTLWAKAGRVVVSDGPFAETKECLGGIVVLGLKDMNDAVASLSKHPALAYGVAIEIRPINEDINRRWEAIQPA